MIKSALVMLDRDGTIIEEKHYLSDSHQVELLPGALEGLKMLKDAGLTLAVVSNQSGVGRGYFRKRDVDQVNQRIAQLLANHGVSLDGFFYCPHTPQDGCDCRKPKPGLAWQAGRALGHNPSRGFLVGDKQCDIAMGHSVSATTLLVRTGYGAELENQLDPPPSYVADNLQMAARIILHLLNDK